ncbi:MAG: glutathione peroxidase [Ruminococcus sp.]
MSIYEYKVKDAKGRNVSMANYRGKVLLIVNTAPNCGLAPQYEALQALYEKYRDQGFEILDFPCNQFGNQAAGSMDEINIYCDRVYHTTFRRFGKIDVNGGNAIALFCYLKSEQGCMIGSDIKWNFTKFLVDRQGKVVARFEPLTKPENIEENIKELL